MSEEIVEIFRLLHYVGKRGFIDHSMSHRSVKGCHVIDKDNYIEEAILGDYPHIILNRQTVPAEIQTEGDD